MEFCPFAGVEIDLEHTVTCENCVFWGHGRNNEVGCGIKEVITFLRDEKTEELRDLLLKKLRPSDEVE